MSNGLSNVDSRNLPASFLQSFINDPASQWPGAPANYGQPVIPHIVTVQSFFKGASPAYSYSDEALRDSPRNAEVMRTECAVMECVEARERATTLLKWHIIPENETSQEQKDLVKEMTMIVERTPQFQEIRRQLMGAIWYGRYAVACQYGKQNINGNWRTVVHRSEPRHGDKLVFRVDDGTGIYDPSQIGIRVGQQYLLSLSPQERARKVAPTQFGMVYWLDNYERKTLIVHKHMIEDGPFNDPIGAGRIHGVGVRDRIYWAWYAMQECLANMLEYLERSALGIEIWRYPSGNVNAEEKTRKAAQERIGGGRSIVLVPVTSGEDAELYGVQHIEPGMGGVDAVKSVITDYFGAKIKRYILGQTLTSEAAATGLGSGVADAHMATFADIVQYDANKLSESLTTDFLCPLQKWNFPQSQHIRLRFVIDTESDDPKEKMEAFEAAYNMGLELRAEDVRQVIGARKPNAGDEVLRNPQSAAASGSPSPGQSPFPGSSPIPSKPTVFGPMGDAGKQLDTIRENSNQPDKFSEDANGDEHDKDGKFAPKGEGSSPSSDSQNKKVSGSIVIPDATESKKAVDTEELNRQRHWINKEVSSKLDHISRNIEGRKNGVKEFKRLVDEIDAGNYGASTVNSHNKPTFENLQKLHKEHVKLTGKPLDGSDASSLARKLFSVLEQRNKLAEGESLPISSPYHDEAKSTNDQLTKYTADANGDEHAPSGEHGGEFVSKGEGSGVSPGKQSNPEKTRKPSKQVFENANYGQSKANVYYGHGLESLQKRADSASKDMLGTDDSSVIASVVGAPDDAEVTFEVGGEAGSDTLEITIEHENFTAKRIVSRDSDGEVFIKNDYFFVKDGQQGKGLGASVFGKQVENAVKSGVSYIQCHAAKENPSDPDSPHNGYYTWPRFGFDMRLDDTSGIAGEDRHVFDSARKAFPSAKSVLDIMETSQGREWWKKNGTDILKAKFDLSSSPKSRSLQIFDSYLKEKK